MRVDATKMRARKSRKAARRSRTRVRKKTRTAGRKLDKARERKKEEEEEKISAGDSTQVGRERRFLELSPAIRSLPGLKNKKNPSVRDEIVRSRRL